MQIINVIETDDADDIAEMVLKLIDLGNDHIQVITNGYITLEDLNDACIARNVKLGLNGDDSIITINF